MKRINIFCNDIINIFLNDNIYNIEFLGVMDDVTFDIIINKFNEFFDICKKKNNKFYLVINFTTNDKWKITNLLYYGKYLADYLINNKTNLDNYLYGTIIITVQKINFVWNLFTKYYTPVKPLKIITPDESIDFSFIQDTQNTQNTQDTQD